MSKGRPSDQQQRTRDKKEGKRLSPAVKICKRQNDAHSYDRNNPEQQADPGSSHAGSVYLDEPLLQS